MCSPGLELVIRSLERNVESLGHRRTRPVQLGATEEGAGGKDRGTVAIANDQQGFSGSLGQSRGAGRADNYGVVVEPNSLALEGVLHTVIWKNFPEPKSLERILVDLYQVDPCTWGNFARLHQLGNGLLDPIDFLWSEAAVTQDEQRVEWIARSAQRLVHKVDDLIAQDNWVDHLVLMVCLCFHVADKAEIRLPSRNAGNQERDGEVPPIVTDVNRKMSLIRSFRLRSIRNNVQ